ncbi:MAG: serine/threonine-protein kinase, partial [Planctomycetota bacterium]
MTGKPEGSEDTDFQLLGLPSEDESNPLRSREPFELLASQFVEEIRTGRKPSIELYARRYPPHARQIRDVFPMLSMLENARIEKESQSIRRHMPDRFPLSRLGNCELLRELGRGGMGVVFKARDLDSGHLVAIKILPWRTTIVPGWVERFEREAKTAAQLRHRNIVPVFRYGQENGYCYFVMQLVRGVGLDKVIAALQRPEGVVYVDELQLSDDELPRLRTPGATAEHDRENPSTVQTDPATDRLAWVGDDSGKRRLTRTSWISFAKVGLQATQALNAAHKAGIMHNDIKPANLLLDAGGRIWVSDFGLSQPLEPTGFQTNADRAARRKNADLSIAGTLKYMAPERLMGKQTAACDLYSLGATLYELCLQRSAFEHPIRDELTRSILEDEPPKPHTVCKEIPKGLETIILNAMAKNPSDRYATARQMQADLLKFSRGQRVSST